MKRTAAKRKPPTQDDQDEAALWAAVRLILHVRAGGLCELCSTPVTVASMEGHHRRSRGVRGLHRHCPCNALALCSACHHGPDVHDGPERAKDLGTIVSRHSSTPPSEIPVILRVGKVHLDCRGGFLLVS
jgi:hypothetical protein